MSARPARRCVFLGQRQAEQAAADDLCVAEPLAELGWQLEHLAWDQPGVDWSAFDAAVLRSTWDYIEDPARFLATLEEISRATRLANPLELVRWNCDKRYLQELAEKGAPILPTVFRHEFDADQLPALCDRWHCDEIVLKPTVGANAVGVRRLARGASADDLKQAAESFRDRALMLQPLIASVGEEGEYSLIFLAGEFSHAVLKVAAPGEFRIQERHGGKNQPVQAESELIAAARELLPLLDPAPLYVRLDWVRDGRRWCLMEVELIEPSLFLSIDSAAAGRFARAIDGWFAAD